MTLSHLGRLWLDAFATVAIDAPDRLHLWSRGGMQQPVSCVNEMNVRPHKEARRFTAATPLYPSLTHAEQRNSFKSGSKATFKTSTGNRLGGNTFPEGFNFDFDSSTCFTANTNAPLLPKC